MIHPRGSGLALRCEHAKATEVFMFKATLLMVTISAAMAALVGCSSEAESKGEATGTNGAAVVVRGRIAPGVRVLDNARAMLLAPNGKSYVSFLDARGQFSVTAPAGTGYRLVIANARASKGTRAIGHLVVRSSKGSMSKWLTLSAGTTSLGELYAQGKRPSASAVSTKVEKNEDQGVNQDQQGTVEEDYDDLCGEHQVLDDADQDADIALEGDASPGDVLADDSNNSHQNDDDELPNCAPAADPPGGGAASGAADDIAPPGGGGGGGGLQAPCLTNRDCAAGLGCFANVCAVPLR